MMNPGRNVRFEISNLITNPLSFYIVYFVFYFVSWSNFYKIELIKTDSRTDCSKLKWNIASSRTQAQHRTFSGISIIEQ